MKTEMRFTVLLNSIFAILLSVYTNNLSASDHEISAPNGQQQNANQDRQATPPSSSQSAEDVQKSADAARKAEAAAEEAKKAKSGAETAAGNAKDSASAAQTSAANSDNAKADATDAAQNAQTGAHQADNAAATSVAAAETAKKKALQADAAAGVALNGSTNVKGNVTTQVVLLPRNQAEKVFSKEIGRRYAVVQVTINNKNKDAAFLLHSIFVDYSRWALSGMSLSPEDSCPRTQDDSQTPSCPGQVASVESRVIRGELQDAANWTWRNGIIRAAVIVGTVASGIPAFSSKNAVKYVGAYNGQFIPGVQVFWPDETVPQLNRVSDLGFQNNKVIAKETADIVYAFFPIDRFLTPGMSKIFLYSPAVFFAPAQIFVDQHIGKHCWKPGVCLSQSEVAEVKNLIEDLTAAACTAYKDLNTKDLCPPARNKDKETKDIQRSRDQRMLALLTMDCVKSPLQPGCAVAVQVQRLVERTSLNSISVLVQGVMTVDVTIVPPSITDITFDKGNDSADVWQQISNPLDGSVSGRFLTGGTLIVTSVEVPAGESDKIADYIDPKTISVVADESNDTRLRFKLQWKKSIPEGSKLHFQVTKSDPKDTKNTSGVKSMDFVMPVNYVSKPKPNGQNPTISDITVENGDVSTTWKAGSKLNGDITGSTLDGGIPTIEKISVPGDQSATADQYIDAGTVAIDKTKTNDSGNLHFTLSLKKTLPPESILVFQVAKGTGDKATTSGTKDYTVRLKK
jgi:hypothetical protein